MKKTTLLLPLLLLFQQLLFAQVPQDTITIKKGFGTVFMHKGKRLTTRQLSDRVKENPEAFKLMSKAKSNQAIGSVFGFAGGFLVGWPLGTAIGGGDPNWTLAAVGAGLIGVSIPFNAAYNKHATNAVHIYNEGLRKTSSRKVQFNMGVSYNRVGLKMNF